LGEDLFEFAKRRRSTSIEIEIRSAMSLATDAPGVPQNAFMPSSKAARENIFLYS